MTCKFSTPTELFAASSWLAGVSLDELYSGKISPTALKTCCWVYAQLDAIMDASDLALKGKKPD